MRSRLALAATDGDALWPASADVATWTDALVSRILLVDASPPGELEWVADLFLAGPSGKPVGLLRRVRWVRAVSEATWAARVRAAPAEQREALALAAVARRVREVLRAAEAPDPKAPLSSLGFDSMMGVELRAALAADGLEVPLHRVMGDATMAEMAAHLAAEAAPPAPADATGPSRVALAAAWAIGVLTAGILWALFG
jgi:hypothetical protein